MPHSIIEDDSGGRFDVTIASWYSFLEIEGTEEEFVLTIQKHGFSWLDHNL
jgi:hypothetical protein